MDNSNIISASDILDQPPPPPPRHSSKITPPPLPPKSSCWIVNNSTSSTSGSNGTVNPHHSPHHKSHHHHHSSPSSSTQPEATKKDDLKAIQKRALLEFYLKHKKKQHQHHSTSSLHQQTQLNHHQSKNQHSKSSSTSNIFHPTTNASSSKVELVVSNPSNGFTNTSESFNCLPSSAPRNHTGLTANMNHCSNSTSSSSPAIPASLISSVNPPKHQHSGNGYVCGGSDSNRLSPTSKLSSSTIVTTTTTTTTSSTSSASSSSASSSPPPLPPLPLKSHIGSLLLPPQPPPPPPSSAQITKNSTPTVINCESNMLVASKSSASPPIALKTVTLNNSQPPLPPNPMHLHHHHNKQKQIITNSQPLPVSSSPRSELLETDLTHLPILLSDATSMDPLPSLPAPHLHSKTPSNASSNTLDSESCFTGPGSSGTLTSNCSSSSGIGSSSSSSSSSSDSSNNGHSGCNDPLLPNAITNDIIAHKTTSPSFPINKTDTHLESLSSFPNYPPPPPPPPPPLPPLPLASSSLPLPPPPCPSSSSSPLGSHSMTVRVSGSMLFESDDNFNFASIANFSDSSPITSYQRPVSIGAIESTTIISTTPSLPVRSYSSNNHNNHLDGHSHQNHSHHLNFNNSHHNHEPTRLSNNNSSSIGTPENSVSCNQGRFNKRDSVKSNGKLTSNSNCYNTVTASGSTSPPTTTSPSYLNNAFSDNTVSLCDFRQYHSNGMLNCRSSSPSSSEVKNRDEMNKLNGNSLCDLRPNGDGNNKLLNDSWSVCRIETPPSIGQYQSPPHPTTTSSSSFFPLQSVSFAKSNKRSIDSEVTKRGNKGDNHHHGMIIETSICSAISKGEPIDGGGTTGSGASSDGYSSGSLSPTSSPSSLDLLIDQPYVIGSTLCGQPILSNSVDAIPKLTEHLDCLRSEYSQMKSEILANETTGTGLLKKLTLLGITCQESEKISIHLEEIEKITRLLLSLSSRLKSIEADIRIKKHEPPPSTTTLGGGTLVTNCTYTSAPSNNNNNINNSNGGCENLVSSSSFLSSASSCSSSLFFNRNLTSSSSSSSSSPSSGFHVTSIHNNNHHLLPSSSSSSSSLLLSSNPSSFPVPGLASVLDNGIDNTCNNNNNSNPELESLLLKRNKLLGQLEEAIGLKQSIDRTSQTISDKIIVKYFKDSNEDVDSFVRFIQLKPKLILEEKQLIDKIEIRERQLLNLTNAT